jgi:predicted acylesterase/phospholipase RssA
MKSILALVASLVSAADSSKSCQALAMSGGGSKGAYEVGGLWGIVKNAPKGSV